MSNDVTANKPEGTNHPEYRILWTTQKNKQKAKNKKFIVYQSIQPRFHYHLKR